ncbi:MAG: hypothetical protein MUF86_11850 [Akkermansiaceae bacterium]|nr:hypothetical protein [Akkermansiaceae bacterium]
MMKRAVIGLMVPAMIFLGACGKKEQVKAPETAPAASATETAPPPVPEIVVKPVALSAEERAAMLGFVRHLPQDTEVVMSLHNGSKAAARVKSSKLWQLMQAETGMDFGDGPEDEESADGAEAGPEGPSALFGREFTIALGKPVGEQTAHLLRLNGRSTYFQMRMMTTALAEAAKSGDFDSLAEAMGGQFNESLLRDILADPESGVPLFERMAMPPLYLAFRTTPEGREAAAQQLAALTENLGMFGEIVEAVEVEKSGHTFAGQKISGAAIAEGLRQERSMLDGMMEAELADRLIAAIARKDLVVLSGTIGDYALLFFGSSADDLVLVEEPAQSLAATEDLAFCDAYADKELAAIVYGRKESLKRMTAGVNGLDDITGGLRDGLAGTEALGDTRDLEALLRMVSEREASLRKLASTDAHGLVAFFDDGLKIEGYGGTDSGAIDWEAPNKLATLGSGSDVALFINMTTEDDYDEKLRAFIKVFTDTAYALAMHVADLPGADGEMAGFKEMADLFDGKFRPHLVAMWDALGWDFSAGLGGENALVVDLSGTVPPIPGVPQSVADDARFPRVSLVSPVTDRAKIAGSWEKMNLGIAGMLKEIGEMNGQEIPMQKPISSERDGFTTWFFAMPFFNDDFLPSVTVGDEWFAASTSKNQALDLLARAGSGEPGKGLRMQVNFAALAAFANETLEVLAKNPDAVPLDEEDMEDIRKLAAAMEDFDKLSVHVRRENGQLRSSTHLKTR